MKKTLRFLSIILSFVFLFGCGQAGAQHTATNVGKLPTLVIYNSMAFLDPTTNRTDGQALRAWQTYMTKTYNTPVFLLNNNDVTSNSGIEYQSNPESIVQMANSGAILPLDDYLKNNESWNALPDSIKDQYSYQGHIWAVPPQVSTQTMIPMIDKTWLQNVNLPVPQSLNDLAKVGEAFANDDPNKNSIKDDYLFNSSGISLVFASEGFTAVSNDIVSNYTKHLTGPNGLKLLAPYYSFSPNTPIGANESGTIGYDLKTGSYNDSLLGNNAKDALTYLNTLYNTGAFSPDSFLQTNNDSSLRTNKFSFYGMLTASSDTLGTQMLSWAQSNLPSVIGFTTNQFSTSDFDSILNTLTPVPPLSTNPQPYINASGAYVLLKNTNMPKESINLFVDMMFATPENYLEFSAGIPSNYKINADHTVTFEADSQTQKMPTPANLAPLDGIFITSQGYTVIDTNQTPLQKFNAEAQKIAQDYITKYTQTGQLKQISPFDVCVNSQTYLKEQNAIRTLTIQTITAATTGTESIDEALSAYRTAISDDKIEVILGEANKNAKTQTSTSSQ